MSAPMSQLQIKPLERLVVNDGLLLTAQLWQQAHDYHRQRQNIYYQSLHQPGIVSGLGVCLIEPPTEIAGLYKDKRWLEIQPGIAIDVKGNPIVVPQPLAFRISSEAPKKGFLTVYIVVEYVDPDHLINNNRQFIQETFRINEKTTSPEANEIELCRILLEKGSDVELLVNTDVFNPRENNLDLRYRQQAKVSSSKQINVAFFGDEQTTKANKLENKLNNISQDNLKYLLESMPTLYPEMRGEAFKISDLQELDKYNYDLLYINYQQFLNQSSEIDILQNYLETGAVLLIEASEDEVNISELGAIKQQLQQTLSQLHSDSEIAQIREELTIELAAVNTKINQQINNFTRPIIEFARKIGIIDQVEHSLSLDKIIRTKPFLFSQLPIIQGQVIHLYNWGGIILVIGCLSQAWGVDDDLSFNRETIRSAQEMGINILHFANLKHQLTRLSGK
ncbi:hypothetical protein NIES267_10350 [Calothrix parasitica NIES-267]|uniref:DUF4159 domain-containing protein n=1 Tax=Calothrix parasitica NIES-267 TaxID=1973488 RepID=A0A1Z4LKD2_9CYAN|nr:hypothetical protein NIES267_10350 [Calothrix parasitica NIES-267]